MACTISFAVGALLASLAPLACARHVADGDLAPLDSSRHGGSGGGTALVEVDRHTSRLNDGCFDDFVCCAEENTDRRACVYGKDIPSWRGRPACRLFRWPSLPKETTRWMKVGKHTTTSALCNATTKYFWGKPAEARWWNSLNTGKQDFFEVSDAMTNGMLEMHATAPTWTAYLEKDKVQQVIP